MSVTVEVAPLTVAQAHDWDARGILCDWCDCTAIARLLHMDDGAQWGSGDHACASHIYTIA